MPWGTKGPQLGAVVLGLSALPLCCPSVPGALEETLPRVLPRFHTGRGSDGLTGTIPAEFWPFQGFCYSSLRSSSAAPSVPAFPTADGRFLPSPRPRWIEHYGPDGFPPLGLIHGCSHPGVWEGRSHLSPWQGQALGGDGIGVS